MLNIRHFCFKDYNYFQLLNTINKTLHAIHIDLCLLYYLFL